MTGRPRPSTPFPTRRSSDLPEHDHLAGAAGESCRLTAAKGRGIDLPVLPRHAVRDRKSTRLNSSHMSISYAVFCLKKKKVNPFPPPRSVHFNLLSSPPTQLL